MPKRPESIDRARHARVGSHRPGALLWLALALLLAPGPATAAPAPTTSGQSDTEAPGASGARSLTLKNGARVLLVPDPRAAAVSVGVWVDAGVRYERAGSIGLSHLVEHLSARGLDPGGVNEVRRRVEALGGTTASFTTADFSGFVHDIPRTALETVLQLETRRFAVRPTQAMLDEDRATVRAENRNRSRLNPLERPLQALYAAAFPGHPYRFPPTGIDADLGRITLKDCQDYLRSRYTPDHALITVVGDFDPDEATALLHRTLETVGGRGDARAPAAPREPESGGERRQSVAGDVQVPIVVVGWRAPANAGDATALELLSAVLSGGSASRLPSQVVGNQENCLFARAAREVQSDAMLFWVAGAIRPGADSAVVEQALVTEVERLAKEPVRGDELDRARKQMEVAMLSAREGAADRAQAIGVAEMVGGDWRDVDREMERLRALTPSDLQQAAARTFTAARRTVVWLSAAPAGADGAGGSR